MTAMRGKARVFLLGEKGQTRQACSISQHWETVHACSAGGSAMLLPRSGGLQIENCTSRAEAHQPHARGCLALWRWSFHRLDCVFALSKLFVWQMHKLRMQQHEVCQVQGRRFRPMMGRQERCYMGLGTSTLAAWENFLRLGLRV